YADDSKISRKIEGKSDCLLLQHDIDGGIAYPDKWQLRFNIPKCKSMYIGHVLRNYMFCYSMMLDNVVEILEEMMVERDLGIWMDNNLKFSVHVEQAVAKANQMLGLIK